MIEMSTWAWPQFTWIGLMLFNVLAAMLLDGREKSGKHSAGVSIAGAVLSFLLLMFGGFFA